MKRLMFFAFAAILSVAAMATGVSDTLIVRIKAMRCEECAHKVTVALRKDKGVKEMDFDLERRTVTVQYDPSQTCRDSICSRLAATGRYKPSGYDPEEMIRRGMGLQMGELENEACAGRIMEKLKDMVGIDSLAAHIDKGYMFIRYDANKTCKADIKEALMALGFTPTTYYTSKIISFAYFKIPAKAAKEENVEQVLALKGVDDATINPKNCSLGITYVNTETNEEQLLKDLKAAGIKAKKRK